MLRNQLISLKSLKHIKLSSIKKNQSFSSSRFVNAVTLQDVTQNQSIKEESFNQNEQFDFDSEKQSNKNKDRDNKKK